ncbi:hypothetical protein AaE_009403 [Aphanomyces astaci]|uniref:C3H1-type domain-containing protein n=1 Tax=Aphanomyces astaci TaxID=112090 RepID=A0A6A4ZSJ4_APHAT|nr:hypothetical protein AaE_009403 [Aphanomyces astaci]
MAAEEAVVRARIAALKSLLDTQDRQSATSMSYGHARYNNAPHPRHVRHTSRAPVRRNPSFPTPHSKPRHLTWTPPDESSSSSSSSSTTPLSSLAPSLSTATTTTNPPKRPASVTTLALEDGMYRKMGRGFKLRREDTLPKSAVEVSAAIATTKQKQPSPSPPPPPAPVVISSMPPPLPPPSTLTRRPTPLHRGSSAPVPHPRTELCLFYIKHGECKHKHACLFVHDSRTISMCRSFLRGACPHASACRLSHTPDQVPLYPLHI